VKWQAEDSSLEHNHQC